MLNEDLEKAEKDLEKAKKDRDRALEEKGSLQAGDCEPQPNLLFGSAVRSTPGGEA